METRITQLVSAAEDTAIAGTDAGQGLRLYLKARDQAIQSAEELGLSASRTKAFTEAKAAAHLRNWLRTVGTKVAEEHPDFRGMWDYVWSRELKDDLLEEPEQPAELPEAS